MKIRIQDNSVRFRITIKELETLLADGAIISRTAFPGTREAHVLSYGITSVRDAHESRIRFTGDQIIAELCERDLQLLKDDSREGVYCPSELPRLDGERFIFFIEKDRPGSACEKPEHWIYEESAGKPTGFRPIKGSAQ
ncbi:MAG: DUF7009 family protein [Candidatus Sumerlaeaceae bacterium]